MVSTASLSTKLVRIGAGLLLVGLASIGLTLWVTWQLEGGAAAVNEAGRMRMQTWRLTSVAQAGRAPAEVAVLVRRFDESLNLLRRGDASRPLFVPWDEAVAREFAMVEALWQSQRPLWLQDTPPEPVQALAAADTFVEAIDSLVLAIEKQLSGFTAILNLFQFLMMALAIGAAVVMLYTGYMYVIHPLAHLRQGLRRLESGDFKARVEVETLDEFGQVAGGFNRMASTLQSMYAGLESQVESKTRHIEAQRARLETLYEVSAFMAEAVSIDALSRGFAQRVRAVVKADAVALRWSDEANQRYLMLASDCFPNDMVEEERSLLAGACACGNLQPDARTRVIPIRSHDEASMRSCVRAGFETLVSVPVRLQHRLIGEINLFYRSPTTLSAGETELLDALASHLANALESLRAAALEREAAVGEERALIARELHDSIAQSLAFLNIQVQLLRKAAQKGQDARVMSTLDELDEGLRESINDVRELLVHFRTRTNTDDIERALQETLQKFQHQTGLPAKLHVEGHGLPLPADVQVQVLHVLQESLSNVRKHAGASQVQLDVFKGPHWRFRVRDDGAGFDALDAPDESHVGLKIMVERATLIGARVDVSSEPGQGTTVTLTLPAHPVAATSINAPATEHAVP
ncbi:type IV pili methyl-accepting chemotaxis transducer N-terminal domain-containing protein [Hydrogenophaga sp.]|uniref:type IV pili methyl-accepting chemotaxis transducer N-terminal domain-containing protein n=1 Tax=Hydrogenophaga sp. TaxID=1904254 RepID=UPI00273110B0|nr:type IV pili methyl-accepting chemotaxis transducer N-terminal domain-containing protein [Hydrogenophaga sp.]MDP2018193.1 type IV pili methyl-accepting chemotaxis transducer N-terminal domain-containing protein [Hydrogenophaga sp.]MDP3164746.1 type IV pili methyl-accepting chemotaxis transducer N-terminal domain-containing protein [Hydrogenophaga sp.]